MVVQVTRRYEFGYPSIETVYAGSRVYGQRITLAQTGIPFHGVHEPEDVCPVVGPDGRMVFEPALKVGAPENLLDEPRCR
jgi:hypothetical protein